jgi:hypothetical protein
MQKIRLYLFIAGTLIMMVVMSTTGASLKTATTPMGILNLELPFTVHKANTVLSAWKNDLRGNGKNNIEVAKTNTWWDFLFILFYSGLLFLLIGLVSRQVGKKLYKAGEVLKKTVWAVAILDIAENIGMFCMLNGTVNSPVVLFTSVCAALKWVLVLIVIAYIIVTAAMFFFVRKPGN